MAVGEAEQSCNLFGTNRVKANVIFHFHADDERFTVARPPLARVIAVLRYPLIAAFSELGGLRSIQAALGQSFPDLAPAHATQIEVTLGPNILHQQQTAENQWLFRGHPEGYELTIAPGWLQIAVPGPSYRNREQFSSVLEQVLQAFSQSGQISRFDVFAVRYINAALAEPGWSQRWNPAVVGWIADERVAAQQRFSMTQTTLTNGIVQLEDGQQIISNAIVRHGLVPGLGPDLLLGATSMPAFVVDCELQMQQTMAFDIPTILRLFREYNHEMARFFDFALSEQGRAHFGMEAV
jgi:uncharacterized protein (TIGR04255 family)